jgi:hypothetical protein
MSRSENMKLEFTEEQQILKQTVKKFLEKVIKPYAEAYTDQLILKIWLMN